MVVPGLPLLIICEVLKFVLCSVCVVIHEAEGHGVWAQLPPGHPCGHWQSLDRSIAPLPPADSASRPFRYLSHAEFCQRTRARTGVKEKSGRGHKIKVLTLRVRHHPENERTTLRVSAQP